MLLRYVTAQTAHSRSFLRKMLSQNSVLRYNGKGERQKSVDGRAVITEVFSLANLCDPLPSPVHRHEPWAYRCSLTCRQAQEERIKELNQLDIELYQYVSHLHDESIKVHGEVCACSFVTNVRTDCPQKLRVHALKRGIAKDRAPKASRCRRSPQLLTAVPSLQFDAKERREKRTARRKEEAAKHKKSTERML